MVKNRPDRSKCQKRQQAKRNRNSNPPPSESDVRPNVSNIADVSSPADLSNVSEENRKALQQFLMTHCTEIDENGKAKLIKPSDGAKNGILALIPGLPGFGMPALPVVPGLPGFLADESSDSDVPDVLDAPDGRDAPGAPNAPCCTWCRECPWCP